MNYLLHDMIGIFMEVYIDDIIVKSQIFNDHLVNLVKGFLTMMKHQIKMNPLKCTFNINANNFLGFLVHSRGIKIDQNKAKAIIQAKPPSTKKECKSYSDNLIF